MDAQEPGPKTPERKSRFGLVFWMVCIWAVFFARDYFTLQKNTANLPYSEFVTLVEAKKIKEASLSAESISGEFKEADSKGLLRFYTARVDDPELPKKLRANGVTFSAVPSGGFFSSIAGWLIPFIFIAALWWFFLSRFGQMKGDFLSVGKSKARIFMEKGLRTRFTGVAGVEEAKDELREVVNFLKNPSHYSRLGGRMPKGILLVGPPGTGKTLLARAVAGEAGVPFFSINGSEFVEMFVGIGAARVRDLFEQARKHAPCIIFIDELDALGKARGLNALNGSSHDEKEQTLNQLLAELDGFDSSQGLVLLAATNRPEVLDPALLRSGRFDRQILVDKPDKLGREQILKVHTEKLKIAPGLDMKIVASLTAGFSGADLANLANEAALIATRRGAEQIELRDFTEAMERIVAGLERKNRLLNPDEKRRVAFHEMGHAIVALALGAHEAVHKISVIPRGIGALGYTFRRPTDDRYLMTKHELENKMAILLGGRAAEKIFFNDISTGAADDLDKATEIARAMVMRYGMSDEIGLVTCEGETSPFLAVKGVPHSHDYSQTTAVAIDREVGTFLDKAFASAMRVLNGFSETVREGAELLIVQETLNEEEIAHLWQRGRARSPRAAELLAAR
ncbi:MAG: ATP-dependent zinc metalloprotease FtsH [Bdellovibrionia bacterium]